MKQTSTGTIACAARGCARLTLTQSANGSQPYPVYYCEYHTRSVPSVRTVAFEHGFTVMMDFSPYFKDIVEES